MTGVVALLLLAQLGCPKGASSPREGPRRSVAQLPAAQADAASVPAPPVVVPPGPWSDPHTGLRLRVPTGWQGVASDAGADERLALRHAGTGAVLRVRVVEGGLAGPLVLTPDCTVRFQDPEGHRSVPGLGHVGAATCVANEPDGPTTWVWTGESAGRTVWIALVCPAGTLIEARLAAEPVLESLSGR